nr:PREDICTED: nose resistant to fluoxetine protein 6-like [Bemisia tabaci]
MWCCARGRVWALLMAGIFCSYFGQGLSASTNTVFFSLNPFLELYAPLKTRNAQCYVEARSFIDATKKLTPWALQMLDASSKIPTSVLDGNVVDLGNFDQCLAVRSDTTIDYKNTIGKYCLVKATFNQTRNDGQEVMLRDLSREWTWSVCMPASCTPTDLTQQLEFSLGGVAEHIKEVYCQSSLEDTGLSVSSWLMIVFTFAFIVFVFAATWIEYRSIRIPHQLTKSVVISFSLITNGKMLLSTIPPGLMIDNIHGIRVISMLAVIAFHRAIRAVDEPNVNHGEVPDKLTHSMFGMLLLNGLLAVDVFFLLGGMVLAFGFMRERKAQYKFSFAKHVLYRYLRITPAYFFVILIYMTVLYDLGSGPIWEELVGGEKQDCRNNWWTNILYINNYWNASPQDSCYSAAWYLGTDMQFYVLAPLFLFALNKNRKHGIILIVVTCLASCIYTFWITYVKDYPWTYTIGYNIPKRRRFFVEVYLPVQTRIPSYLIGILLGYFLDHYKKEKIGLCLLARVIGWTLCTCILIIVFYGLTYFYWFGSGPFLSALYASLHRPLFAIAIGWIIFVCDQGYGGPVNEFLSHQSFQILSRLCFCFYLVHYIFILFDLGMQRTAGYFSYYHLLQKLAFDVIIVLFAAAALSLTLEHPFIHLNKLIFKKNK